MNWPFWLFAIAAVACLLLFVITATRVALLLPISAVAVYLAFQFQVWSWVPWVFWGLIALSVIFFFLEQLPSALVTGAMALLIAFVAAFSGIGSSEGDSGPTSTTTATTATTTTTPPTTAVLEVPEGDLQVKPGDVLPRESRCQGDKFLENSLPSTKKYESDSPSIGFVSKDPDAMLKEVFVENCQNPTVLDMSIQGLATVRIGDFSVWDENPWLEECQKIGAEGLWAHLVTREGSEGFFVTAGFQRCAEMVNTLLLFYKVLPPDARQSVRNWHLAGPDADDLPPRTVENEVQEDLPALILAYTLKDVCGAESVIGYNVFDKRFEVFEPQSCEAPLCSESCGSGATTTTTPGGVTTTTTVGRKGTPATTTPPPPTVITTTPATTSPSGGSDSGAGAPPPSTTVAPTPTVAPPGSVPTTSHPPTPGTTIVGP